MFRLAPSLLGFLLIVQIAHAQPKSSSGDTRAEEGRPTIDVDVRCSETTSDEQVFKTPGIRAIAQALLTDDLRTSSFLIAYRARATAEPDRDQMISNKCAEAIRRVLIERYGVAASRLVASGHRSSTPVSRLQLVNLGPIPEEK